MPSLITLTTDFGCQDHYVGVLKAVILSIAPDVRLIDISHDIPPQDIMAGAWVVRNSAMLFPDGSVHLVVVDPGVGTKRKPIAMQIGNQFFVGPDNGIFSLIADQHSHQAVELNEPSFWRPNPSHTFHGRDIFAPVAAHLANGASLSDLGSPLKSLENYRWAMPISDKDGVQGWVVHIDRFGNLITNIPEKMVAEAGERAKLKIYVGNTILNKLVDTFGEVTEGEPAAYIGSAGMLEIAINKGDAHEMLGVEKGAPISIVVQK